MARGQADFGATAPTELIGGLSDLGELAARLGSIVTYDRRGNVLLLESFEDDISKWETEISGAGASVVCSAEHSIRGLCAMKLTAGSTLLRYAKATARLNPITTTRFGTEIGLTLDTNMESWEGWNNYYTGAYRISGAFKFDRALNKFYILTSGDTWLELALPVVPAFSNYLFYFSKSVFDIDLLTYIRHVTANISYDISAVPLSIIPDLTTPMLEFYIKITSQLGFNAVSYLDSCIMTYNEP